MKKILTCLFAALGLTTACAQGNYETDVFKTKSGKTVTFHALVHASIRIQYDGKEIQIDPVRKQKPGQEGRHENWEIVSCTGSEMVSKALHRRTDGSTYTITAHLKKVE